MRQSTVGPEPRVPPRWAFFYDGHCGFCVGWVRALRRLDFLHRVEWVSYQSLDRPPPGLSRNDLERSAFLQDGDGRWHEGFYAFRKLAGRLPPLLPLYPFLRLPGVNLLGVAIYRRIARNRRCLSRR